ncbi:MAG: monovalent cation/H+ antiporter complex subunit F [Anaerolineae bacterium]|nr:hypothetical protein [Anaerolineae bacterium]
MDSFVNFGVQSAMIVMVLLLLLCSYRIFRGPTPADRLQAIDFASTLLIGITVLLAIIQQDYLLVDVGIAVAGLGFVGTVAVARYLADGQVF